MEVPPSRPEVFRPSGPCHVQGPGGRFTFKVATPSGVGGGPENAPVGGRDPGGPGRTVKGVSALLRTLPRPTRADAWFALTLLFLSMVSTLGIEVFDPVPGNLSPWPWGYALIVGGSALLATAWGLALAGLLAGEPTFSFFTVAWVALGSTVVTVAVAASLEGLPSAGVGAALVLTVVLAAAPAATGGASGPMLAPHTSALAITVPGLLVAFSADLPSTPIPEATGVFVWSMLLPVVPVMLLGQVWLYRMTRRPATEPTFFS